MDTKQKKRNEIEEKYKWDLSSIYDSKKQIDVDIKKVKKLEEKIIKFEKSNLDEFSLYDLITNNLDLNKLLDKLIFYANLKINEDCSNEENQKLYGEITSLLQDIYVSTSFVINKILNIDYEVICDYINKNKKLEEYKFLLELMFRDKKHMLSDKEEKLLANLTQVLMTPEKTYDMLTNLDIKFGNIEDEDGNIVELTDSNVSIYLKSKDRNVRKKAYKLYYSTYGKYSNTISTLYNYHLISNNALCNIRGFDSMLSESLYQDNLSENIYNNIIDVASSGIPILQKYYAIKKQIHDIQDFHMYDKLAPFPFNDDKKYSFEEAKEIILDIFKIMGDEYHKVLEKAFNERWIDVFNNEGKSSGAFSSDTYLSHPVVLMNYEGTLSDIGTIAHELGHSVHSYLSSKNNPYQYYDYSLFLAEVASLTNEIIFNVSLIDMNDDPKIRLSIIDNLLKMFINNFYDSAIYAEFEKDVHSKIEKNEALTKDYICNLCLELNKKYYSGNIIVDEEVKYRWEIYSHLYTDFYLFKYATGISCAAYCANKILNNEDGFLDKYLSFLKIGGSMYDKDALLTIGIDVDSKDFIESAVKFFEELIEKFRIIYDSIKK